VIAVELAVEVRDFECGFMDGGFDGHGCILGRRLGRQAR
jgi:hypothetical protein